MGLLLELAQSLLEEALLSEDELKILPHLTDLALDAPSPTLEEFVHATRVERLAFSAAVRRRDVLAAHEQALAASGPVGAALALAEFDDGAALEAVLVETKLQEMLRGEV